MKKIITFALVCLLLYEIYQIGMKIYQMYYMKLPMGFPHGVV